MKKIQILVTIAFVISIISFNVYSAEANAVQDQNSSVEQNTSVSKEQGRNPLKRLEERKAMLEKEYKDGKITKDQYDEKIAKINKHIEEIKEFESLSLPEKKAKISEKVKSRIEQQIKDGVITKEEGDNLLREFNKKLESWDGKTRLRPGKCEKCPERKD